MDLSNLQPGTGSRRARKRVGRGTGSGNGKTAGRGHKGRNSRSGGNSKPGYEGGQMPLQRRLPKRGFHNPFRREMQVVNLTTLSRFDADSVVDPEAMLRARVARKTGLPIKILGTGALDRKLTVKAHGFSRSAREAIESQGGTAEVIE
ncbi:MAG: 50S ribosomal protein L15 [Deltaproteobacteria bacterium]|nr:50S ribosomal protein L15 [Deltaproteobacteria bacterium]